MNKIEINKNNYISHRLTPWDARVFGFSTREVLEIKYDTADGALELIRILNEVNKNDGIAFTYTRIDASDIDLKRLLQRDGFYFAECSLKISLTRFGKIDFSSIYRNQLNLELANDHDIDQIKIIARDAFNYGRFLEDSNLPHAKSQLRNLYWIDDILSQKLSTLVHRQNEKVLGFMVFDSNNVKVNLILGGCLKETGYLSPYFWSSLLTYFQKNQVKKIETIISAANTGIGNIYFNLGFNINKTLFGFHKFY